jgi:Icc-related predicted phosphoesterase
MTQCFAVSDLHGSERRYRCLFQAAAVERPRAVFLGGDLLPHFAHPTPPSEFLEAHLLAELERLRDRLGDAFPKVFVVLGNDDGRGNEGLLERAAAEGLLAYVHGRRERIDPWTVYGYAYVPPTPFHLKDWERYDVSRYVDPGCIPPEEGAYSVPHSIDEAAHATIWEDLAALAGSDDLEKAVFLFHAPPYDTDLDRAALDGVKVDHASLDVHVGSIAVRRFIETRQPLLTLHGHVHESARLTGSWKGRIGRTVILSAAHDGPELALVRFALEDPSAASRELL